MNAHLEENEFNRISDRNLFLNAGGLDYRYRYVSFPQRILLQSSPSHGGRRSAASLPPPLLVSEFKQYTTLFSDKGTLQPYM
jgi:hypothetical protein